MLDPIPLHDLPRDRQPAPGGHPYPGHIALLPEVGAEHPHTGDWEASIVSAPFRAGSSALGAVGVVGPTAMDYVGVMASVRAVARRLSELATELDA